MRVLVTGAFGRLGPAIAAELLSRGHHVRGLDLETRATRRAARRLGDRVETIWGDLRRDGDVRAGVAGVDAVVHAGGVLAPASEADPCRTADINVGGTRRILEAALRTPTRPLVVLLSSLSVYGPVPHRPPPRRVDEPPNPTDAYTRSKVAAEGLLRAWDGDWLILRVAVSVWPGDRQGGTRAALARLFETPADNRFEWVHPADVARAVANALETPAAWGHILNIGGGPTCQISQGEFLEATFGAAGLGPIPPEAFGDEPYYVDWLDSAESQRLLHYQQHSFDDFRRESDQRLRAVRWVMRPLRRPATRLLLRASGPWRRYRARDSRRSTSTRHEPSPHSSSNASSP